MLAMDHADRVIHASSFSKTVSPGVRVGYLAGPAEPIATLSKRGGEHYISPNMLAESVVLEMCRSGDLSSERRVRERSPARAPRRAGRGACGANPRGEVRRPGRRLLPLGGPRDDVDTPAAPRGRQGRGRPFVAGPDFMLEGGESSLRFSFASVPPEQIAEGVARVARALASTRSPPRPSDCRLVDASLGSATGACSRL